ncbi:MAG: pgdS 3 [Gemmatimonadetes bacterium]|nr:pgdS 3 [Gemmatimonadota bacterium]
MSLRRALLAALGVLLPAPLAAQGILLDVGYVFRSDVPDLSSVRAAFTMPVAGPIRWGIAGELLADVGTSPVQRWGAGVDLTGWRGGRGPYAALSLDGGFETDGPHDTWASWSAGAGYDLHLAGGVTIGADARYRGFFGKEPGGVQVSAGLAVWWGRKKPAEVPTAEEPTAERPSAETPTAETPAAVIAGAGSYAAVEAAVVATAREALGKPYLDGGTGQGDDGEVERSLEALAPGDILTFSGQPGGSRVSHVGLYLGDGRFIHSSSSKGVMESTLSASDPNGQWWFVRWVGARRVIEE